MDPGQLADIEVSPFTVLTIPADIGNKREDVITVIPGLVVLGLETDRRVKLFQVVQTRVIKQTELSGNIRAPAPGRRGTAGLISYFFFNRARL
jgi:hypothetical protein